MTPDEINALPERVRAHIHALETNADPAGTVRQNVLLRDEVAQLRALVEADHQDAERYRWLRDKSNIAKGWAPMVFMCDPNIRLRWVDARANENLDAAIDAAMGSEASDG